jgi:hypothetical protein
MISITHDIRENIIRRAVFEDGIRFIGVGEDGGCAGGRVFEGLCCGVESGVNAG